MNITYKSELNTIEGFWTLFESTGWNAEYQISARDLRTAVTNSWHVIAAYDGDRLVGFGRIVSDGILHAMVYDLITDSEYQCKGIGTEILTRLVEKCRESNIPDIQLFCARGKRAFYEHRGFRARHEESPGMEYVAIK
ncbi:MAG: GNAT family N-acetyltransferase [Ignavibacteriales bacterium]|nr:GNAT family N-acetyltransferase [Ignavibacteriales bacterium]MBI3788013.1 GNAT family N-acetyltransferase [Ignavibacteriales bacterium]